MRVLITGGASGLGAAVVAKVHEDGGRPLVLDRRLPQVKVEHIQADLCDRRAAERAVHSLAHLADGLDAVVTAAGVDCCGSLGAVPADDWERVVKVNLLGTVAVIRAALPYLTAAPNGQVVTCASTLGLRAVSDATAYCAAKFGVVGFTRALAVETAGRIGVTLLMPGGMDTAFFDGRDERHRPPSDSKVTRPQDVAAAVLFALRQPPGCEVRELVITPSTEPSWP